jgi:hypothetical protein
MIFRGFQQLQDRHEENMEDQERLRRSRVRALARELQQKHRDTSRERKVGFLVRNVEHVRFTHYIQHRPSADN